MILTLGFVAVIVVFFIVFLICGVSARGKSPSESVAARYFSIAPGFLTTLGVFGTFAGILIGLLEFDVTRVDESVPLLLDGLKIAFVSSVAGLLLGLIIRFLQPAIAGGQSVSNDPMELLANILRENQLQSKALSGGEDSSLLTQLQKIRTKLDDSQERHTKAIELGFHNQVSAFQEFAEQMAENNSKALIEALEDVIRDFNTKISEQFGENFKQLNAAVGALLEWQERYKIHIEETESRLQVVSNELERSTNSLTEVSASLSDVPQVAATVEKLINDINGHLRLTGDIAGGVGELKRELSGALPEIKATISELTSDFSKQVQNSAQALAQSAEDASTHYSTASNKLSEGAGRMQAMLESNFEAFDKAMQDELSRALQKMGSQLASISKKLAEDYDGIAKSLSRLRSG